MRDFSAETVRKRNFIFRTIREVFELYGFEPLETPAMENLETLMGKYGEEGDRLIFKVLNNGLNDPKNSDKARLAFESLLQGKNSKELTERALKYDLTIPFARYVAMNHTSLTMPFRRYQIQPVWRADRPQKGRYREFTQCDADVVGSRSLINEVELIHIYDVVFKRLRFPEITISINSRKILTALANICGGSEKMKDIAIAIDKMDKVGEEKVIAELFQKGFDASQAEKIKKYLSIGGTNEEKLSALALLLENQSVAMEGIADLTFLCKQTKDTSLQIDPTLARGLDYYTGAIFEIRPPRTLQLGSLGGGGRYDDLTGLFGVPGIPGVGISFGIDRIYDAMEELGLFPDQLQKGVTALFFNMGEKESAFAFEQMNKLRSQNVSAELFSEPGRMDKQFKYADKKKISFAVIIGSREMENQVAIVKELSSGVQQTVSLNDLASFFISHQ